MLVGLTDSPGFRRADLQRTRLCWVTLDAAFLREANLGGAEQTGSDDVRASLWREVGLGAQILRDLGVSSIRLRTDNPRTYVGLSGFGIEIAAVEPLGSGES